jgi:hypothetical protein
VHLVLLDGIGPSDRDDGRECALRDDHGSRARGVLLREIR